MSLSMMLPLAAFVTPGLAAAGLAVAGVPVIIHLLNRRRFKTVEWAAMRFVLEAMRRNRRRLRFESWLLLAMRCLLVACVGLALARPVGCDGGALASLGGLAGGDRVLHLLVVDNSGSAAARRAPEQTTLDQVRAAAAAVLQNAGGEARAAVVSAARPASDVVPEPAFDLTAVESAVAALPQTFAEADLAGALERVAVLAEAAEPGERVVVHVLTDAAGPTARDPRLEVVGRRVAAAGEVRLYVPSGTTPRNVAVVDVRPNDAIVRRGFDTVVTARVAATGPAEVTAAWAVAGQTLETQRVNIAAEPAELAAPPSVLDALADGAGRVVRLALVDASAAGDALAADDVRLRVIERVSDLPVLVVEGRGVASTPGGRSLLATALAPGNVGYLRVDRISDLELPARPLDDYRAVVLSNVGGLDAAAANRLADFARGGGTLMVWLGEATRADDYRDTLGEAGVLPGVPTRVVAPPSEESGGFAFDFDPGSPHRYLEAFRGVDRSGLNAPVVLRYWQVEPADDAETVLRFAGTGHPAVLARRVGDGSAVLVATSADDPDWTLLPLLDNFPAFVHELFRGAVGDGAGGGGSAWQNLSAGDRLIVPPAAGLPADASPRLLRDGQALRLERDPTTLRWTSDPLDQPGIYELAAGEERRPVVLNMPASQSDLRTPDAAALRATLGGIDVEVVPLDEATTRAATLAQTRPDWGWPLLIIAGLLALGEAAYAAFLGNTRRATR